MYSFSKLFLSFVLRPIFGIDDLLGGLALGVGGAAAGAGASAVGQGSANAFNQANRDQIENWQNMMSSTAYQRSVTDMKAAGINPMLAVSQGGASTPSGASMSAQNPISDKLGTMAISTALDARRTSAELDKIQSETDLNNAQKEVQESVKTLTDNNSRKAGVDADVADVKRQGLGAITPYLKTILDRLTPTSSSAKSSTDKGVSKFQDWVQFGAP